MFLFDVFLIQLSGKNHYRNQKSIVFGQKSTVNIPDRLLVQFFQTLNLLSFASVTSLLIAPCRVHNRILIITKASHEHIRSPGVRLCIQQLICMSSLACGKTMFICVSKNIHFSQAKCLVFTLVTIPFFRLSNGFFNGLFSEEVREFSSLTHKGTPSP